MRTDILWPDLSSFGIRQVEDKIWLVSFMNYDLGYFNEESNRVEPGENPFGAKVLPMSPA